MPNPRLASAAAGVLLAASPLLAVAAPGAGAARTAAIHKVFPAAVRIHVEAGGEEVRSASGVAFAADDDATYVLTNAHVVLPASDWRSPVRIRVLPSDDRPALDGRVIACGSVPDWDLAVVEVKGKLPTVALAADDDLDLGEDLFVIGAPFGKGLSVAAGILSEVEYEFAENAAAPRIPKSLKTDAAIGYGSSGGGVFDVVDARLIGLVEGYRTARVAFGKDKDQYAFDVPMPGETFVAPAAKIRRFLARNGLGRLVGEAATDGVAVTASAAPRR